jgi:hypothetical protein
MARGCFCLAIKQAHSGLGGLLLCFLYLAFNFSPSSFAGKLFFQSYQ